MKKTQSLFLCFTLLVGYLNAQTTLDKDYKLGADQIYGSLHPDAPPGMADFDPMIGTCDCWSTQRNAQQEFKDTVDMVWDFKYILNGMAVQDETWKSDGFTATSIRQYNVDSLKWYVTFFSNSLKSIQPSTWVGQKEESGDIVLWMPQKAPNGMDGFSRLTFHEISDDGFKWTGEWVDTNKTFTYPFWFIECKKRR